MPVIDAPRRSRERKAMQAEANKDINGFLAVVEVWVPDAAGRALTLQSGYYDRAPEFGEAARDQRFLPGEGLPGRVWQTGRPVLLDGLVGTGFVRTVAAAEAGLGAALAIPYRRRGRVAAVVMFLLSVQHDISGVLEIWRPEPGTKELALSSGYYGGLTDFAEVSRRVRFALGEGLPGQVWRHGRPQMAPDVRKWSAFVRRTRAEAAGITTGVGIPLYRNGSLESVVTLFGTKDTPLARHVDVLPTSTHDPFTLRIPPLPVIARRWRRPVLRLPVHGPRELTGLISITF